MHLQHLALSNVFSDDTSLFNKSVVSASVS